MELGTFGAVMKYAIDLETIAAKFYQDAIQNTSDDLKTKFQKLQGICSKRISTLERIRRENVTEMILEPIRDLNSEPYELDLSSVDWSSTSDILENAMHIERTRKSFFQDASLKIEFLIEAADAFERLADQNDDHFSLLG